MTELGENSKTRVKDFWNAQSCGEVYATGSSDLEYYKSETKKRYELEPYIQDFAKFYDGADKDVLEIGVGMGTDHSQWALSNPLSLNGVDLTPRAIDHVTKRFSLLNLNSTLKIADAEKLPFDENSFDIIYSYGVLHHSPDTPTAINEVYRALRPGGVTRIMIYHRYSLTGYMLWLRYGLLAGKPLTSLDKIYSKYLESPGTKAYTVSDTEKMFSNYKNVNIKVQLSFGDLLEGAVGQRHEGFLLNIAKKLWPRAILKKLMKGHGLLLLIEATK